VNKEKQELFKPKEKWILLSYHEYVKLRKSKASYRHCSRAAFNTADEANTVKPTARFRGAP